MKLTTNFQLEEFIHPEILERIGDRSADFLHPMLAPTVQVLRDRFGPITINDWLWGGKFKSSGLRLPKGDVGAILSSHRFGTASDLKFDAVEPITVQNYIIQHQDQFPHISRLENALVTKTWLHVECGVRTNSIKVFNP